ncbi:MAG: acyl-CoA synthetase [Candidatus Pelagadaptatus aseana]|uniref:AMP-binding protein n=1 Tax=Candidatus Pelagadaptatus aseana TaxID=3120508 RepID=UPI0039B1BD0E
MKSPASPRNIYDLLQQATDRHPQATAITYIEQLDPSLVDRRYNYSELLTNINRTVRLLQQVLSSSRGVVSILLPSTPETQFILWGAETAGIANPINPLLSEEALASLMNKAETEVILALGPNPSSDIWQKVEAVAPKVPSLKQVYSVGFSAGDATPHFEEELGNYSGAPIPSESLPDGDDICAYFHTGGTTGTPKLAMHSHGNQVAAVEAVNQSMPAQQGDVRLNGLPMFHVAGSMVVGLAALASGANILLPTMAGLRNPEVVKRCWDLVEHYRIKVMGGIPTSMGAFAQIPLAGQDIDSLDYLVTGGAMVTPAVVKAVESLTGKSLYQVYGMTETAGVISISDMENTPTPGSCGLPGQGIEVRIDGANGEPNKTGEICVRGDNVFQGYLGHSEEALDEGWLRTGDLGCLNDRGELFITGRAKDLIIRSGHNIDPAVIENCLENHPAVALAAAVGKPDHYAGELPVVFVELKTGHKASEDELREFAMANIDERPACPKQVFVIDEMPKTAVGKIHKPALRLSATKTAVMDSIRAELPTEEANEGVAVEGVITLQGDMRLAVHVAAQDKISGIQKVCQNIAEKLNLAITVSGSS